MSRPRAQTKALVVPFYKHGRLSPKYLFVHDRVHREWGFLSGTCKKFERPIACALRELREETKNAMNITLTAWNHVHFPLTLRRGAWTLNYTVYFIDVTNYKPPTEVCAAFKASTKSGREYNENDDICFATLDQLRGKRLWSVTSQILRTKEFAHAHGEAGRHVLS